MTAMLRAVIMRTNPQAIPLAMITMRKSTHGFPLLSHDEYGAPLSSPPELRYQSWTICTASGNRLFGAKCLGNFSVQNVVGGNFRALQ